MSIITCYTSLNFTHCDFHTHPHWEICYRISGSTITTINTEKHTVSDGDIYLIPPLVPHSDQSSHYYSDIAIHVDSLEFLDIHDTAFFHDYSGNVDLLIQMLHRIMLEKENNYQNIANSLMVVIFQFFQKLSHSTCHNPVVNNLKDIIYKNLDNTDFDLQSEIDKTGYHPDHIRRLFKEQCKTSPLSYLTLLRINRAKQLLAQYPHESVSAIALHCGFQDPNYFSSCFKKHTGMSPLEYRKSIQ